VKYQLIVKSLSGVKHSRNRVFDNYSATVYKLVSIDRGIGPKALKQ